MSIAWASPPFGWCDQPPAVSAASLSAIIVAKALSKVNHRQKDARAGRLFYNVMFAKRAAKLLRTTGFRYACRTATKRLYGAVYHMMGEKSICGGVFLYTIIYHGIIAQNTTFTSTRYTAVPARMLHRLLRRHSCTAATVRQAMSSGRP